MRAFAAVGGLFILAGLAIVLFPRPFGAAGSPKDGLAAGLGVRYHEKVPADRENAGDAARDAIHGVRPRASPRRHAPRPSFF